MSRASAWLFSAQGYEYGLHCKSCYEPAEDRAKPGRVEKTQLTATSHGERF